MEATENEALKMKMSGVEKEEDNELQIATLKNQDNDDEQCDSSEEPEDDDEEEDEETPRGIFEQPLVVEGSRRRSSVNRLAILDRTERRKLGYTGGNGVNLGSVDFIYDKINKHKGEELKGLYRACYGRVGKLSMIKKELRMFSGFEFKKGDKEYEKRMQLFAKMHVPEIRFMKQVLGLHQTVDKGSNKDVLTKIVFDYLMCPEDHGRKVPGKKRKASNVGKTDTKKKVKRARKDESDEDDEDGDDEEMFDEDEYEIEAKTVKKEDSKKTRKADSKEAKEDEKAKKEVGKKAKKEESKKAKKDDNKKANVSAESFKRKVRFITNEDSPTSSQLEETVKDMLNSIDLSLHSMKDIIERVCDTYVNTDMSSRKDEIRSIVRSTLTEVSNKT